MKDEDNQISKAEKQKLVNKKFSLENKNPYNIDNLNYVNKIYLLSILRILTDEGFDKILPLNTIDNSLNKLSPSEEMNRNILECLSEKEIILVDPESDINAFHFKKNNCIGFSFHEVNWQLNLESRQDGFLSLSNTYHYIYEDLMNYFPTSEEERDRVYRFTRNLALHEVKNYIQNKTHTLGYQYDIGVKTCLYIYKLQEYFSVSELFSLVDKAIDQDFIFNSSNITDIKNYGCTVSKK